MSSVLFSPSFGQKINNSINVRLQSKIISAGNMSFNPKNDGTTNEKKKITDQIANTNNVEITGRIGRK